MPLPFERARKLVWFPVSDDWVPSEEERLWLEEVEALTDDEIRQMERFMQPPPEDLVVVPPDEELDEL